MQILDCDVSDFWSDVARPEGEQPEHMANFECEFAGQPLDAS